MQKIAEQTQVFLDYLGLDEEPFAMYFSDEKPEKSFGPNTGVPISRELEEAGKINMQEVFSDFSCVIKNIFLARRKKCASFISETEYGCPGGVYYCAMQKPNIRFIEHYVSTGFENTPIHGEHYMPSPEAMRNFLAQVEPELPNKKYAIFKPLSQCSEDEIPETVIFFARPEVLSGLFTHTAFTTGKTDSVASPFGAGCTNIVAWPLYYKRRGEEKAVLGGFDPSARKYMNMDEMTFTVTWDLYQKMLVALPKSMFTVGHGWSEVRKKIELGKKQ